MDVQKYSGFQDSFSLSPSSQVYQLTNNVGIKQNFARKFHVSIDQVAFVFDVKPTHNAEEIDEEESQTLIHGLFLEGSRGLLISRCCMGLYIWSFD